MGANYSVDVSSQTKDVVQKQTNTYNTEVKSTTTADNASKTVQKINAGNIIIGGKCQVSFTQTTESTQTVQNILDMMEDNTIKSKMETQMKDLVTRKIEQTNDTSIIPSLNVSATLSNVNQKLDTLIENTVNTMVTNTFEATNTADNTQDITFKDLTCTGNGKFIIDNTQIVNQFARNASKLLLNKLTENDTHAELKSTIDTQITQTNKTNPIVAIIIVIVFGLIGGGTSMTSGSSGKSDETNWTMILCIIGIPVFVAIGYFVFYDVDIKSWKCGQHPAIIKASEARKIKKIDETDDEENTMIKMYDANMPPLFGKKSENYKQNAKILNNKNNWKCDLSDCPDCWKGEGNKPSVSKLSWDKKITLRKIGWYTCLAIALICLLCAIYMFFGSSSDTSVYDDYDDPVYQASPAPNNTKGGGKKRTRKRK